MNRLGIFSLITVLLTMFASLLEARPILRGSHAAAAAVRRTRVKLAPPDYTNVTEWSEDQLKAINLKPDNFKAFKPKKETTGFVIAGKNDSKLIASLPSINGVQIADLEKAMRPGALSDGGFLGKDEKLLGVIAKDNDYVIHAGLTHQEIAKHLRALTELGRAPGADTGFLYRGRRFKVLRADTKGFQISPFKDETSDGRNATIINLETGKKTSLAMLLVPMIERYGFYEGEGTPYRTSPKEILSVLDFLRPVVR